MISLHGCDGDGRRKGGGGTDEMAGMRLSRPLGFGVNCPEGSSFSSEDRVVEDRALSSAGALVGALLVGAALGLDDQNAGMANASVGDRIAVFSGGLVVVVVVERDWTTGARRMGWTKWRVFCGVALCCR